MVCVWGVELGGRKLCPTRQSWPGKETEDLPKLCMFYCKWLSLTHRLLLESPQIPSLPTILLKADASLLPLLYRQQLCLLWSLVQPQQHPMPTGSSRVSPLTPMPFQKLFYLWTASPHLPPSLCPATSLVCTALSLGELFWGSLLASHCSHSSFPKIVCINLLLHHLQLWASISY